MQQNKYGNFCEKRDLLIFVTIYTWDPQDVLEFLQSLHSSQELSLQNLTLKLIMSIALVTSQRIQTLSKIMVKNIITSPDNIQILIPGRLKTSKLIKGSLV